MGRNPNYSKDLTEKTKKINLEEINEKYKKENISAAEIEILARLMSGKKNSIVKTREEVGETIWKN